MRKVHDDSVRVVMVAAKIGDWYISYSDADLRKNDTLGIHKLGKALLDMDVSATYREYVEVDYMRDYSLRFRSLYHLRNTFEDKGTNFENDTLYYFNDVWYVLMVGGADFIRLEDAQAMKSVYIITKQDEDILYALTNDYEEASHLALVYDGIVVTKEQYLLSQETEDILDTPKIQKKLDIGERFVYRAMREARY